MSANKAESPCPCFSGALYQECCKPLHEGSLAENARQLMKSRFSAYVLDLSDYIIKTTHPASAQYSENKFQWKRNISQFSRSVTFNNLEIYDFKEEGSTAFVAFTAYISQKDQDASFTEKSYFEKVGERWLYLCGQIAEGHAPNFVTDRQIRLLPLAYYGDPILTKKAEPVQKITEDLKNLVSEMFEMMNVYNGMGLAAPQIHHSIRLFVVQLPIEKDDKKIEYGELLALINPKILSTSDKVWKAPEACLSIPTLRMEVARPYEITIEYTNLEGKTVTREFSGWQARVILHENDHLDGILFPDRLDEEERSGLAPFLERLNKRIHESLKV